MTFDSFHDYLYDRGITIYPSKVAKTNGFRLANIGDLTEEDILLFSQEVKAYLSR